MANVRLVSAGTGKSIPVGDDATVKELREFANISPDVKLSFNGSEVSDDHVLGDGDTLVQTPDKVGHGK